MTPCRESATSHGFECHLRGSVGDMNKNLQVGLGVLLVLVGLIWTGQGLGWVSGSAMTGVTLWAIIGPIVALLGVLLLFGAVRASRS